MTAVLEMSGVDVRLGRGRSARRILRDVSLTVAPREVVGVIGETGSGKTTLARTVLGLVAPEDGEVRIDGRATTSLTRRARRDFRRGGAVQLVFQDPLRSLDPDRSVADSIAEGIRASAARADRAATRRSVDEALELVGLDVALSGRRPGELSGGQRQRVAIARAIACRPQLLVCDEPVSALDASNRNKILRLLASLRDELGIAIVVIAHDLASLAGVADRVVVLYRGEVVEDGPIHDVFAQPRHPYTALMLASAPSLHRRTLDPARLRVVRANDPLPPDTGAECVFAQRCSFATEACAERPPLHPIDTNWRVACHHEQTWWAAAHHREGVHV